MQTTPLTLRNLPSEILSHIVSFRSSSFIILKLWKSGDSVVRSKLSAGAHHIRFEPNRGFQFPLPIMATELYALRSFYLLASFRSSYDWMRIIPHLPATLETLSLRALGEISFNNPPPFEACSTTSSSSEAINLARLFPKLAHLSIIQPMATEYLPPTLTILDVRHIEIDCSKSPVYVSLLPRSLTQLKATIWYSRCSFPLIAADWQLAPPHLTALSELRFSPSAPPSFDWLPRHLDVLIRRIETWTEEQVRTLPPAIQRLDCSIGHPSWASYLPLRLQSLDLEVFDATVDVLPHLPRSLTKLRTPGDLGLRGSVEAEEATATPVEKSMWPPLLLSLQLNINSGSYIRMLPSSLTELQVSFVDPLCQIDVDPPPALLELGISSHGTIKITCKLPSTLTMLNLAASEISLLPSCVPASLKDLNWGSPYNECLLNCLSSLPNLSALRLASYDCKDLPLIPKTVTSLDISELLGLPPKGQVVPFAESLPPFLRYLSLGSRPGPYALPKFDFPPTLISLGIYGLENDSSIIRSLPKSLEYLNIHFGSFDTNDAPHIPADLHVASLSFNSEDDDTFTKSISWISEHWPVRCFVRQQTNIEGALRRWRAMDL